jgi:hypothetical protein
LHRVFEQRVRIQPFGLRELRDHQLGLHACIVGPRLIAVFHRHILQDDVLGAGGLH